MILQIPIDSTNYRKLIELTSESCWKHTDFWINIGLALLGIFIGWLAYKEAGKAFTEAGKAKDAATAAKDAAKEASTVVKMQAMTIELTEIIQRLDTLAFDIDYKNARDLYNEINRRVRRIISPFSAMEQYKGKIEEVLISLKSIKENLDSARPINNQEQNDTGISVYYAVEGHFSTLSGVLAELSGIFESNSIIV